MTQARLEKAEATVKEQAARLHTLEAAAAVNAQDQARSPEMEAKDAEIDRLKTTIAQVCVRQRISPHLSHFG